MTRTPEWQSAEERSLLAETCSQDPALSGLASALQNKTCSALRKVRNRTFCQRPGPQSAQRVVNNLPYRLPDVSLCWHVGASGQPQQPATPLERRRVTCSSWFARGGTNPTCGSRAGRGIARRHPPSRRPRASPRRRRPPPPGSSTLHRARSGTPGASSSGRRSRRRRGSSRCSSSWRRRWRPRRCRRLRPSRARSFSARRSASTLTLRWRARLSRPRRCPRPALTPPLRRLFLVSSATASVDVLPPQLPPLPSLSQLSPLGVHPP